MSHTKLGKGVGLAAENQIMDGLEFSPGVIFDSSTHWKQLKMLKNVISMGSHFKTAIQEPAEAGRSSEPQAALIVLQE